MAFFLKSRGPDRRARRVLFIFFQLFIDPIDPAPEALEGSYFTFIKLRSPKDASVRADDVIRILRVKIFDCHHRTAHVLEHGLELL